MIAALERCNSDLDARNDHLRYESERRQSAEQDIVGLRSRLAAVEGDDGSGKQSMKRMRRRQEVLEE